MEYTILLPSLWTQILSLLRDKLRHIILNSHHEKNNLIVGVHHDVIFYKRVDNIQIASVEIIIMEIPVQNREEVFLLAVEIPVQSQKALLLAVEILVQSQKALLLRQASCALFPHFSFSH